MLPTSFTNCHLEREVGIILVLILDFRDLLSKQLTSGLQATHRASVQRKAFIGRLERTAILAILHDTTVNHSPEHILEVCESSRTFGEFLMYLTDLVHCKRRQTRRCGQHLVALGTLDCLDRLSKSTSIGTTITLDHLLMLRPHMWELFSKLLFFGACIHSSFESLVLSKSHCNLLSNLLTESLGLLLILEVHAFGRDTQELS